VCKRGITSIADGEPPFLTQVNEFVSDAGEALHDTINSDMLEIIRSSNVILYMKIPLVRDNGEFELVNGYK
jgi:hypothetical protein